MCGGGSMERSRSKHSNQQISVTSISEKKTVTKPNDLEHFPSLMRKGATRRARLRLDVSSGLIDI